MSAPDSRTQIVNWLKILLPLASLILLSTLFLLSRSQGSDPSIPFAEIEAIAREQRIAAPNFSGVTDDGSVITIAAETATPIEGSGGLAIQMLSARIDATNGNRVDLSAGSGRIDTRRRTATLEGLTRVRTSNGYVMETRGLTADLASGRVTSDGAMEIRAPYGAITAGQLTIEPATDASGRQMLFTGGVRLIYDPKE